MLLGVELEIAASQLEQRLMRAALQNSSIFDHQNLVGTANGGQPMGNDKRRPPLHQVGKALLDHSLRLGVEAGGSFVQNENAGIGQNGARNRDPLALPAGQFHAALADDGVVLQLKLFREFIDAGDGAGAEQFLFGRVRLGERYVLANGSVEQKRILQHHAQLRSIGLQPDRGKIDANRPGPRRSSEYGTPQLTR